jgi:hypothetical protein
MKTGFIVSHRTPLDERVLGCTFGNYPWDEWERRALAAGVAKELAQLGRAVMREAYNHGWDGRLKCFCGWDDDGAQMLADALRAPASVSRQWEILLRTDGLRGDYPARSTSWTWAWLRRDAERLALKFGKGGY